MSGSYFSEPNLGNERGGSSRKSKKSNSDKPKQPQRGLGVAQLEKIRLHGQIGSYHPSLRGPCPTNFNQEDMGMQTAHPSLLPSSSFSYSSSSSASSASYNFHPNPMMGLGDYERTNMGYGGSQNFTAASWDPSNSNLEAHHFTQPSTTPPLPYPQVEGMQKKKNKDHYNESLGSSSKNSESSDTQEELDLELRLSI